MSTRTYLPTLVFLLNALCNYITRWNVKIRNNMTVEQRTLLSAVEAACHALVIAIGSIPVDD